MYIDFGVRSSIRRTAASLKQIENDSVRSDSLAAPILNAIKNTLSVFYKKSEDSETKEEILRRQRLFRSPLFHRINEICSFFNGKEEG